MASYGLTTIQDASVTNGGDEWELFHRLDEGGYLAGLRLFVMPGLTHWRGVAEGRAPTESVRLGPVKVMLSERDSDSETLGTQIAEVHHTGRSVAIHAVTEAELALALGALELRSEGMPRSTPDRIEHGAIIPEALHPDLKHAGVTVVGEPGLVHERGDVYLDEIDSELHAWVHRAGSLLRAGISYAIGSDAPVLEPRPLAHFAAARRRLTRSGKVLGAEEALTTEQALRAMTVEAARSVGAEPELGSLRPGMLADIVVLDRDALEIEALGNQNPVRLTIGAGQILWQRQD
jgi:predicted amidohydrolase YtcJ